VTHRQANMQGLIGVILILIGVLGVCWLIACQ